MTRRRRERPEPAAWDCSGEDSLGEEPEEAEESGAWATSASDELVDALRESGAEDEAPRAWRMAATSSLFRMREMPLRPMELASD